MQQYFSTLIRHKNGAFRKRSSNRTNLKTPALHFRVSDFSARGFLKHKAKMTGDCCGFKFLRRSVDGKHLMRFLSETSVFKFLQRSVA